MEDIAFVTLPQNEGMRQKGLVVANSLMYCTSSIGENVCEAIDKLAGLVADHVDMARSMEISALSVNSELFEESIEKYSLEHDSLPIVQTVKRNGVTLRVYDLTR